ncbi:hypothetical protein SAMN05444161_1253 [Rhizobiales bacterium GAS191]|nr:hypothetical protein SAMN05444161_1253 [Rhizobiales bacterium GAS191]
MNRFTILAALALSLGLGGSGLARAAGSSDDEAFQKRIFGRVMDSKRIHACFKRVYDAPHLAQHPQQNVRTMLLLVTGEPSDDSGPSYGLGMGVTFRKSGTHFESAGNCGAIHDTSSAGGSSNTARCGVDCDGGSIDVAIKDANSVLVSIPEGARIWKAGDTDDQPASERRRFGADDKVFRLDKTTLTDCLHLASDDKDKSAMRRGQ